MANETKKEKKNNPTVTAFFPAPKFSQKNEAGEPIDGTAFLSAPINEEAFSVIQKSVQLGTTLLLRLAPRLNKNGEKYWFMDVLPPLTNLNDMTKYSFNKKQAKTTPEDI